MAEPSGKVVDLIERRRQRGGELTFSCPGGPVGEIAWWNYSLPSGSVILAPCPYCRTPDGAIIWHLFDIETGEWRGNAGLISSETVDVVLPSGGDDGAA